MNLLVLKNQSACAKSSSRVQQFKISLIRKVINRTINSSEQLGIGHSLNDVEYIEADWLLIVTIANNRGREF